MGKIGTSATLVDIDVTEKIQLPGEVVHAITRVFKNLKCTMNYGLSYVGYPSMLEPYSDASWINHVEDSSFTSGWVFLLGGGAILWGSKKQTCITGSTIESEFVALVAAGKEAKWLRNLIHKILIWPKSISPIFIHCDSVATLAKAYSQIYNGKSRHFGVRHSIIRELIMNGVISIEFVQSQRDLADHLTKGLARDLVIKTDFTSVNLPPNDIALAFHSDSLDLNLSITSFHVDILLILTPIERLVYFVACDVKGKAIMKDEKQELTGIKEVDDLEQRIKNLKPIFSHLRYKNLKQKEVVVKSEVSHEEDPLPIDVSMQTAKEDPLPLDIVYPIQEIASSSRDEQKRVPFLFDSFQDPSVLSSFPRVSKKTSIICHVISFAAPVVETTLVASPTGLCGLVPYSDSDSDSPDEMSSPEHISPLPAISPFLCTDSSEAPDSSDRPPSQDPLAWRRALPRSSDYHPSSSSSSSDSSLVHSSGLDSPDQAHSGSSTRDVSPILGYPPKRAPRHSEEFSRWCAASLSTLYPPTTSESSSGDSSERPLHSSLHSAGPSRKRYRSMVDSRFRDSYSSEASIEEDTEVDPIETEVDIELGIGDGDDVRDHVKIDPRDVRDDTEEYEADTSAGDTVEVGIDPMSAQIVKEEIVEPAREDSSDSSGTRDGIVRSFEDMPIDLDDAVRNFYHHMSEVRIDRTVGIKIVQRRLEADQLIARGHRVGMIERINSLRLENLKVRAMLDIERDRVNSLRLHMSLLQEEFRQVRMDRNDTRGRLRMLESYVERHLGFGP
ncbi:hypothetical protein Tco_0059962 [Tanacetum coccineum]